MSGCTPVLFRALKGKSEGSGRHLCATDPRPSLKADVSICCWKRSLAQAGPGYGASMAPRSGAWPW